MNIQPFSLLVVSLCGYVIGAVGALAAAGCEPAAAAGAGVGVTEAAAEITSSCPM